MFFGHINDLVILFKYNKKDHRELLIIHKEQCIIILRKIEVPQQKKNYI